MEIYVLRLSHRKERDKRITTHCALVSRAFLAKKMFYTGDEDKRMEEKVREICTRFGGNFEVEYLNNYREIIKNFQGIKVHLTMYGIPLIDKIEEIKKFEKILVIIGSEKVPKEIFKLADYNISITNQPHSEVAALAVFLDRLLDGKEFKYEFENSKIKIIPNERGKKVKIVEKQV